MSKTLTRGSQLAQGIKHIGSLKRDVARAIKTSVPFGAGNGITGNINSDDMVTLAGEMQRETSIEREAIQGQAVGHLFCCLDSFRADRETLLSSVHQAATLQTGRRAG